MWKESLLSLSRCWAPDEAGAGLAGDTGVLPKTLKSPPPLVFLALIVHNAGFAR